jgi:hypothetical protein
VRHLISVLHWPRTTELQSLHNELQGAQQRVQDLDNSGVSDGVSNELQQVEALVRELELELSEKSKALAARRDAERALNKSLKDAIGLIKPLQMAVTDAFGRG